MNIAKAYKKYSTPKNLQEHMLRVAALSKIIVDNWNGPAINKPAIITACVIHDIAKPVMFDLSKQAQFGMTQKEISDLYKLQEIIKTKFGTDEHSATVEMCKDLRAGKDVIKILENIEWEFIPRLLKNNNFEPLVGIYCDMRISPDGIHKMADRFENLSKREGPGYHDFEQVTHDGNILEQTIQENVKIDLNSITNAELNPLFPELLNLEI